MGFKVLQQIYKTASNDLLLYRSCAQEETFCTLSCKTVIYISIICILLYVKLQQVQNKSDKEFVVGQIMIKY